MSIERITVGIDHSDSSVTALSWADGLAQASGCPLRVVHAWQMPLISMMPDTVGALPSDEFMIEQAEVLAAKTIADAGATSETETVITHGPAGPALSDEADDDVVVVVGRAGHGRHHFMGRISEFFLGSTAHHTVHHGEGPIAVVPDDAVWSDTARVIVGVDGSPSSLEALEWAIEMLPESVSLEARRYVIPWAGDALAPVDASFNPMILASAERELASWVATTLQGSDRPDRTVATSVDIGSARWTLAAPDLAADAIVVGHRGRTGIARVLGSVADHLVRHARVPVVVFRD